MRLIYLDKLEEGMEAGDPIYDEHNRMLLARGATIRSAYVNRLKQMGMPALYVQDKDTADISVPQIIPQAARVKAIKNLTNSFETIGKATEGFRQMSIEDAHHNIRSKKFMDTFKSLTRNQGIDQMIGDVDTMVDQLMNRDVVVGLNSIKTHDNYTFQHSIDVTIMAILLAKKLGWSKERLRDFGIGCLLHDLGKIFIDGEILNKPAKLDEGEFDRMKAHPSLGYELVKSMLGGSSTLIPHVAYQHHERQDGSGYPRGISGDNTLGQNKASMIHDFGSVAAVADIYDAVASDRPYRSGWPPDKVVGLIKQLSGTHLNSRVVDIFLKTVAPYPIGTMMRVLSGTYEGCEGVVADVDESVMDRPKVRVMFDPKGVRMKAVDIGLKEEDEVAIESVRGEKPVLEPLGSSKSVSEVVAASDLGPDKVVQSDGNTCGACGHRSKGKFCPECGKPMGG